MNATDICNGETGEYYAIDCMVGSYNVATMDAILYMETDRLEEKVLLDFLDACSAKSVNCNFLDKDSGMFVLSGIRDCTGKDGFKTMETGSVCLAEPAYMASVCGGEEFHSHHYHDCMNSW